jgi:hypothetical protein
MDDSNSDLDIPEHLYSILDPEFCTETMIRPVTLLFPLAIQQVSQRIASEVRTHKHPFPVLPRYFVAKARDTGRC